VGCLTNNKSFDFAVDTNHDPDPETFQGIFITAKSGQQSGVQAITDNIIMLKKDELPWRGFVF